LRGIGGVLGKNERADIFLCAELRIHGRLVANGILHLRCLLSVPTSAWTCDSGAYFSIIRSVLANQFFVIPFEDHQTGERVSLLVLDL
jgi:hypothetical protein